MLNIEEQTDFNQVANWLGDTRHKNHISKPLTLEFGGTNSEAGTKPKVGVANKGVVSRLDYARYEAVAVRYAFQKSGLAMPAAVVTAKGRFIYVVTFAGADRPVDTWDVEEFEIHAGTFASEGSIQTFLSAAVEQLGSEPPTTRNRRDSFPVPDFLVEMHRKHSAPDVLLHGVNRVFVPKIEPVKDQVYADFRRRANRSRRNKAGQPYVDGTVAVTGDFVRERHSLGSVLTFYSPKVAQDEFIATLDQERPTSGERFVRRRDRHKKDDPDGAGYEVDSEALASRLIEHVQSQFLLDMFKKDGGVLQDGVKPEDVTFRFVGSRESSDGAGESSDVHNGESSDVHNGADGSSAPRRLPSSSHANAGDN